MAGPLTFRSSSANAPHFDDGKTRGKVFDERSQSDIPRADVELGPAVPSSFRLLGVHTL